jgi:PAS domain S-box-containing protein
MGTLTETRTAKRRIARSAAEKLRQDASERPLATGDEPAKKVLKARAGLRGRTRAELLGIERGGIKRANPRPSSKTVLNTLPTAICQTDAEGWITYHNAAAAELWGRAPVIGESRWCGAWRLYWPDGRAMAHEESPLAALIKKDEPIGGVETIVERPDGTRIWVVNYPTPLRDAWGHVIGAVNTQVDVTRRSDATIEAQRLAAIVEGSEDAVIGKTLEGEVTSWNASATRIFGYSAEEMVGSPIGRIIPDDLQNEEREIVGKLTDGERLRHFETIRLARDGRRIPVSLTASPLRDAMGAVVGVSTVARDISERRSVQEALRLANELQRIEPALIKSEQRFRLVVEAAPNAMVMIDAAGRIEMVNAQTERLFGYARSELLGEPVEMLVPERSRLRHPGLRAAFFDDPRSRPMGAGRELFGLRKDGSEFPVEIGLNPIETEEGAMVLSAIVDISARKQAEDALRDANEVAQQARIVAENASRAKTEFLAVMSHEIRTPLNSIGGFVDLLTSSTELTPQQRRYAELVKTANAALLTVVNDILDFSKVEAGQLELEVRPFCAAALIHDTVEIVLPTAKAKELQMRYSLDPSIPEWINGDHARLRQILLNLLNNAIKFTDKGSIRLDVRPQAGPDGRERILFSVADTGIGIAVEQQHRLFKQFSQGDSSVSRQHGGTGLGLAICKRLVELMGGEIGLSSELGAGSTVWFTACLPRTSEPAPNKHPEVVAEDVQPRKARILVIDDIDTNLEIVEAYLVDNGYRVDCVTSGLEAIQMLGANKYDLILMDIQMPIMDGVAATKRIRAMPAPIRDIPIIAMTGNVLPQQVRSFLEAGMNDHVGKPIERAKLYNNVRRWLPKHEGAKVRVVAKSPHLDSMKLDEFVLVVGAEKAERIAERFLASMADAFNSTLAEAQREAHALINAAGVLGLDAFVDACRRVAEFAPPHDPDRARLAIEELRRAQSVARQTLLTQLLPRLRGAQQHLQNTG